MIKMIMENFEQMQIFTGENYDPEAGLAFSYTKDGEEQPVVLYFADGMRKKNKLLTYYDKNGYLVFDVFDKFCYKTSNLDLVRYWKAVNNALRIHSKIYIDSEFVFAYTMSWGFLITDKSKIHFVFSA